jgi:hypothetical protein
MIDSYVEQCKQAGRELAIKEAGWDATFGSPLLASSLLAASGLLSKSPRLRAANRLAATGVGVAGGVAGALGRQLPAERALAIKDLARSLPDLSGVTTEIARDVGLGVVPLAYVGGRMANKLVRGSEKLQPILAKRLRS